jgi:ABC-2 type transport system permease protein
MIARALTWWTILRIGLEERLVYRGDFALGTLMRFLPIITQIFLWWAVFESIGGGERTEGSIAGYSFENMVAYYLLTMVTAPFPACPAWQRASPGRSATAKSRST